MTDIDLTIEGEPEEVEEPETIELLGRTFRVAESIGLMALMKFAHFAKRGASTADMGAMDAMYSVLQSVIHQDDWEAFVDHAIEARADMDQVLGCVREAITVMSARPTRSPGGSDSGRRNTAMSSSDGSSSTASSTPASDTSWMIYPGDDDSVPDSPAPLLRDPRVRELVPLRQAARSLRR